MLRTSPSHLAECWLRWRGWLLAGLTVTIFGCGSERYQQRLQETVEYFEYQDRINRELGSDWSGRGISLRPPRQFVLIPPPAVPQAEEGDEATTFIDASIDPRQPHYLGVELPGLVAAWEAQVDADGGDSPSRQTAYLYLLSNYDLYLQQQDDLGDGADPHSLIVDIEGQLCGPIGVYLPEGNDGSGSLKNSRYQETVPSGLPNSKYRQPQEFTAVTLSPTIEITDYPIELQLYEWEGKNIQAALLMVYPAGISPRENLPERLLLALETFKASDQTPRRSDSSTGAGNRRSPAF